MLELSTKKSSQLLSTPLGGLGTASLRALTGLIVASLLTACVSPTDEGQPEELVASAEQGAFGYAYDRAYGYNTRVRGSISYNETSAPIHCVNAVDHHPPAERYKPAQRYCALKFRGKQFDKVRATVSTTDSWGTYRVEAYLFDASFNLVDSDSYDGSRSGHNRDKAVKLELSPGRQIRREQNYYIAFTKYAVRYGSDFDEYRDSDAITVRLKAKTSDALPLSAATPPVRPGMYRADDDELFVDVIAPAEGSEKDFDAWQAVVYRKKEGCEGAEVIDTYSKLNCSFNSDLCWFYKIPWKGATTWFLWHADDDETLNSQQSHLLPSEMQWQREASTAERLAYTAPSECHINKCPPEPKTQSSWGRMPCDASCAFPYDPRYDCPLVFNLDGEATINWLNKPVPFDLNGKGAQPQDWVAPEHPFLALDGNGNGVIDDGTELFGTATVLQDSGDTAPEGFTALAQYDDNGDDKIDASDTIYRYLTLWFDTNSNGVSEPSELSLLMFSGISSIDLNAMAQDKHAFSTAGAFITHTSVAHENVCRRSLDVFVADVWFPTAQP